MPLHVQILQQMYSNMSALVWWSYLTKPEGEDEESFDDVIGARKGQLNVLLQNSRQIHPVWGELRFGTKEGGPEKKSNNQQQWKSSQYTREANMLNWNGQLSKVAEEKEIAAI